MIRPITMVFLAAIAAVPASAQETTTYTYDALGRLTGSSVSGGISSGTNTAIQYDPAGNRSRYQVTGASDVPRPTGRVVVVPLNGFTVIPLP